MVRIAGVRFKKAGKIYYFDPGNLELSLNDRVIVETARGIEFGELVVAPKDVPDEEVVSPLKKVIRKATPQDETQVEANKAREKDAFQTCLQKIQQHDLPMKLVDVEFTFDSSKIIFYFTADGRVDFRELVKDLASVFRTRIELRQIGVRDESKMIGGLGSCGRVLCCASFLGDFEPVSIRMAKDQNLSLNPTKISGICGRLMCCLKYENDVYEEAKRFYPELGSLVRTPRGDGKTISYSIFKKTVTVEFPDRQILVYELEEVSKRPKERPERVEKPEKTEKLEALERPDKQERPEKKERQERVERQERFPRPERSNRQGRAVRPDKENKQDRQEKLEKQDRQ